MSFGETWAYSDSVNWKIDYPSAKGNNQSPINITKKETKECDILCDINMTYKPSKCMITVKNRTPIVYFSGGSSIEYKATKDILTLKAMTIHTPSLHAINGVKYDMEIVLYHKISGGLNSKSQNYAPGGTAISILFEKGADHGKHNNFLNSFIYRIPNDIDSIDKHIDIEVGDNWGPKMLLPEIKSYFYYEGSLPFPPAEEGWKWIVFEEIQQISPHILDVLNLGFLNNIRSLKALGERKVSYNSNIEIKEIEDIEEKKTSTTITEANSELLNEFNENKFDKTIIKIFITVLLVLLTIYASLKMAKYIIMNNLVNKILAPTEYLRELAKAEVKQGKRTEIKNKK
jgi:carbonic anhydrase